VRFPLADWIDDHADCRHNLGRSGMIGSVTHPRPTAREVRDADDEDLVARLARRIGVDPARVFLTTGATEGNSWVAVYSSRATRSPRPRVRVRFPEYPPLLEASRWAGFHISEADERADLAVVSQPRNPEGTRWTDRELEAWSDGARTVLIDETFRGFSDLPSRARRGRAGVWTTGSFTKFYGADDVRVGYVVAPPEEAASFARFHGVMTDELPPYSVASAVRILREGRPLEERIRRLFRTNREALERALPHSRRLDAPVYFDRVSDGDALARRCLRASVLVCPGSFFGSRNGVRITLTRRTFARDLAAYLRVRSRSS
jgi:histidinol-phosphate/aromatic aminotransferase/cobyric acid decarboxylase-like protein